MSRALFCIWHLSDGVCCVALQVEVYQAVNPAPQVRVYFMTYEQAVEEQAYTAALKKEKSVFETLIQQKAVLVMPATDYGTGAVDAS